jgi:hypothetical protein
MAGKLDVVALVARYSLTHVGEIGNSVYYELDDDILIAIPHEGTKDDGSSARINREAQVRYFREKGKKGCIAIYFDRMAGQDKDARKVYEAMDDVLTCTALIGGSMLTRAMFSFFLGLARARVPIKLFADLESALPWIREKNRSADRTLGEGAGL